MTTEQQITEDAWYEQARARLEDVRIFMVESTAGSIRRAVMDAARSIPSRPRKSVEAQIGADTLASLVAERDAALAAQSAGDPAPFDLYTGHLLTLAEQVEDAR